MRWIIVALLLGCSGTPPATHNVTVVPAKPSAPADERSALWQAAEDGKLADVKRLIAEGADLDAPARPYGSPLMAALEFEHEDVVRELVKAGAKIDPGALALAARGGLHALFPLFVANGLSVKWHADEGWTALHAAAKYGHKDTVLALLALGADVDAALEDGTTPLIEAAQMNQLDAARVLLDAHAKLDAHSRYGQTPLHWAVFATRAESTEYFSPNGPPFLGRPEDATEAELVELLVKRGAPLDAVDHDGNTPLHDAAMFRAPLAARILVKHGASTTLKNHDGKTPADLARERGHTGVLQALAGK